MNNVKNETQNQISINIQTDFEEPSLKTYRKKERNIQLFPAKARKRIQNQIENSLTQRQLKQDKPKTVNQVNFEKQASKNFNDKEEEKLIKQLENYFGQTINVYRYSPSTIANRLIFKCRFSKDQRDELQKNQKSNINENENNTIQTFQNVQNVLNYSAQVLGETIQNLHLIFSKNSNSSITSQRIEDKGIILATYEEIKEMRKNHKLSNFVF